jgi:secreted PhoX family phosphatase
MMSDGSLVPGDHDGMAAFAGPRDTTILIRNHELSPDEVTKPKVKAPVDKQYDTLSRGGTTTLIVGSDRKLIKDYASLAGTYRNCAGGRTPWGSWISCEETTATPANAPGSVLKMHGYNFEVPISAKSPVDPIPLVAMGRFNHEAVAVDPKTGIVYETEDQRDGLFYRFIPNQPGKLSAGGVLEALKIKGRPQAKTFADFPVGKPMQVEWVRIEDPNPATDTVRKKVLPKAQLNLLVAKEYGTAKVSFTFVVPMAVLLIQLLEAPTD